MRKRKALNLLLIWMLITAFVLSASQFNAGVAAAAATKTGTASQSTPPKKTYTRDETLVCAGGLWDRPSNWNPINIATTPPGVLGLIYETLYWYDPIKNEMIPWLAEKTEWVGKVYKVHLRKGVKWSDGKPLTSRDVKFTWELAKNNANVYYHHIWEEGLKRIDIVDDYNVNFVFTEPRYKEWENFSYLIAILPEHIWLKRTPEEIATGSNPKPVGCGPYLDGGFTDDKMIYIKNENWWAIKALGIDPAPKKIEYLKIVDNSVAMGMLLKGELDFCNLLLPGVPEIKKDYPLFTWFEKDPYMLSDSTAFMFLNTTRKPMDNAQFRKALAYAIDTTRIANDVYKNSVVPANPLGFLPIPEWMQYYNKDLVAQKGFSYNTAKAKELLDQAGCVDRNNDGFRETAEGKPIKLILEVPEGWSDWIGACNIIVENFKEVGINAGVQTPPFHADGKDFWKDIHAADFDLAISNFNSFASNTTWTMLDWLFKPVDKLNTSGNYLGNYGRYDNDEVFSLVDQLNRTPQSNTDQNRKIIERISEIYLDDMPSIPLWYNGMWFQASEAHWVNWPNEKNPYAYPSSWLERWECGTIKMLANLKPKK